MKINKRLQSGYLILEALLAIVILGVLLVSVLPTINFMLHRQQRSKFDSQASLLVQEGQEVAYNILNYDLIDWSDYDNASPYKPVPVAGTGWSLEHGIEHNLDTRFTRQIRFDKVYRDTTTGERCDPPSAICQADDTSRLVTTTVDWVEPNGVNRSVKAELLLVKF